MTNDYKKYLLDYLTDVEVGTPTKEEIFKEIDEVAREKWVDYLPENWSSFRLEGMIKSNTTDKIILYGGYVEQGGTYLANSKGIIIITDQDLNPIKTIYKYSSGTDLRPIMSMYQEEDGQFVAVDSVVLPNVTGTQEVRQALSTCEKRVIMVNDITTPINDEYIIILRRSYIIGNAYKNIVVRKIFKNPSSSHYSLTGIRITYGSGGYQPNGSRIVNLKINVGTANEWNVADTSDGFIYGGANVYYDSSDNANWCFILTYNVGTKAVYTWEGQNDTVAKTTIVFDPSYSAIIDSTQYNNQVVFTSNKTAYFVLNNQQWGISGTPEAKYIGLFEVNIETHYVSQLKSISIGNYDYCNLYAMYLQVVNGELYINYVDNVSNNKADFYVQRYKGKWQPLLAKEQGNFYFRNIMYYVSQTFNLLKQNVFSTGMSNTSWLMEQITEVYNIANYNGENYENYNSLKARYGNIYSNDKIVFSRNLHNLSITNNYSVASIEVPNSYLNDINLNLKELVGETNTSLVEDGRTVTKNIYEVLYLNYINSINVKNNDGEVIKDLGMYVNNNINTGTKINQNNTRCDTCLINYSDNTSKTFNIGWTSIDDTHKVAEFTILVDKAIESIELTSNDLTKTYITIRQELEIDKYYTFKQYLKVE